MMEKTKILMLIEEKKNYTGINRTLNKNSFYAIPEGKEGIIRYKRIFL